MQLSHLPWHSCFQLPDTHHAPLQLYDSGLGKEGYERGPCRSLVNSAVFQRSGAYARDWAPLLASRRPATTRIYARISHGMRSYHVPRPTLYVAVSTLCLCWLWRRWLLSVENVCCTRNRVGFRCAMRRKRDLLWRSWTLPVRQYESRLARLRRIRLRLRRLLLLCLRE